MSAPRRRAPALPAFRTGPVRPLALLIRPAVAGTGAH
jgi:hypothetical protein